MKSVIGILASILALLMCLLLSACGANQVITSAELAIDAAEAALPAIGAATGLPAATQTAILNYLQAAATGLSQSAALLSQAGSAPVEAAQITALFANVIAPDLPAGTPQSVAAAVNAVSSALAAFLGQFETTKKTAGSMASMKHPHKFAKVKLSKRERERVASVKARADALLDNLAVRKRIFAAVRQWERGEEGWAWTPFPIFFGVER